MRWNIIVTALVLIIVLGGGGCMVRAVSGIVWVTDNLAKIRREDSPPPMDEPQLMRLEAAQNEWEGGQVLVHALSNLNAVTVSVSPLVHMDGEDDLLTASVFRQFYVNVTQPTSVFAPGWYPDALLPHTAPVMVQAGHNQGFWISLKVPSDQRPGAYRGTITVIVRNDGSTDTVVIPLELVVWDFALPDASHSMSAFAVWGNQMANFHGIALGTPRYWQMLEKYYWFQTEYRLPPNDLPIPYTSPQQYVRDAERFLSNPKVSSFRIPFIQDNLPETKHLVDLLREGGWLHKGYFYLGQLIDEPNPSQYDLVRQYGEQLKEIAPDVRHVVTTHPTDPLFGAVDTWAANIRYYDHEVARQRQALGEHVWWYTAVVPRFPYPSYHVDDDLIGSRLLSWYQWNWDVEGLLYWATTIYDKWTGSEYVRRNVFEDPLAFPGSNGDGFLLYPWIDGPAASLRLEAIRDGLEDLEYLVLLQERLLGLAERLRVDFSPADVQQTVELMFPNLFESAPFVLERDTELLQGARRSIADWITLAGAELPALWRLRPLDGSKQQLFIWSLPGVEVMINGRPVHPSDLSGQSHGVASYAMTVDRSEPHVIEVAADGVVQRYTLDNAFVSNRVSRPAYLTSFEKRSDLDEWRPSKVAVSLSDQNVSQGRQSLRATFAADVDFPSIFYTISDKGTAPSEWAKDGHLVFDVWNDEESLAEIYVKFHHANGTSHDQTAITVPAKAWKRVKIPLSSVTLDRRGLSSFQIWMWRQEQPTTLYFDSLHLEVVDD